MSLESSEKVKSDLGRKLKLIFLKDSFPESVDPPYMLYSPIERRLCCWKSVAKIVKLLDLRLATHRKWWPNFGVGWFTTFISVDTSSLF